MNRIEETGEWFQVELGPREAKYVAIYNPIVRASAPVLDPRAAEQRVRGGFSMPWGKLPEDVRNLIPVRKASMANVSDRWRAQVNCNDIDRLVADLARYEARNLTRDQYLTDHGFTAEIALAAWEYPPMFNGLKMRSGGYMLILRSVWLSY